jgi:hypothetical protein
MLSPSIATPSKTRTSPRLAAAASLAFVATWLATHAALAGPQPVLEDPATITSQPTPHMADEADDGFVSITKVVPRAKIVLQEKQRLPDRGAEKTFSSYAKQSGDFAWSDRSPIVPMYPFAYHPLYFEDMNLERCGLSCGCWVQPVVSGVHFFGTVAILPYKMLVAPPCSYVFPPGECPPCFRFSHCENFFGPAPDFSSLPGCGKSSRSNDCR